MELATIQNLNELIDYQEKPIVNITMININTENV